MKKDKPDRRRGVSARTDNQKVYIRTIIDNYITFCFGPPGTGKTHVAAGIAATMLYKQQINRIVICRPVVEVGKGIGYLPGTVEEKVGPYLVPLFDELSHFVESKEINKYIDDRIIEIVPLSMMRGRTFNDSFVILDESQNATYDQLKTLLTRIGQNTKMVVVGDTSQSDLAPQHQGDFAKIAERLSDIDGISTIELTTKDIVRHSLIAEIEQRI
jgi:phosphate starvation-inducible PhoH-like protein